MTTPTEFFRWWIVDERTGKGRRTTYMMTLPEAAERYPGAKPDLQRNDVQAHQAAAADRYPGAEPDLQSREVRILPDADEIPANSRPGGSWS